MHILSDLDTVHQCYHVNRQTIVMIYDSSV